MKRLSRFENAATLLVALLFCLIVWLSVIRFAIYVFVWLVSAGGWCG